MSICDQLEEWEEMSPNDRFMAVRDHVKGMFRDMGMDDGDVAVTRQPPPAPYQDRRSAYDPNTNTMYLHPDLFQGGREGGWKYAFDSASHEAAHVAQDYTNDEFGGDDTPDDESESMDEDADPDGWDGESEDGDFGDDDEGPDAGDIGEGDAGDDGEGSDGGSEGVVPSDDAHAGEREGAADDFGSAYIDALEEACNDDPDGAESAMASFLENWLLEQGAIESGGESGPGDFELPPGDTSYG